MENLIVNVDNEFFNLNSKVIFEYSKVMGELDYYNIKALRFLDGDKSVEFLFYGSDFFAFNVVNFKNDYEYNKDKDYIEVSENLNNRINKIPNVAKTRGILKIDDIEARIYDMKDYILLLTRDSSRIMKVKENGDLEDILFSESGIDVEAIKENVVKIGVEEEEREKEEKSLRNRFKAFRNRITGYVTGPWKFVREKLFKSNEVRLLGDGKHSIFEK